MLSHTTYVEKYEFSQVVTSCVRSLRSIGYITLALSRSRNKKRMKHPVTSITTESLKQRIGRAQSLVIIDLCSL